MIVFALCLLSLSYVYGGSKCVDRADIYPCICIDRHLGKTKYDTTVVCQGLTHGEALQNIEPGLSSMDINRFLLYDSYWSSNPRLLRANSRMPVNLLNLFKIEEVKVVDTLLSSFNCPQTENCRTTYLKRFIAINSSVAENPSCSNALSITSWITCSEKIEVLTINECYKSDLTLKPDFFPDPLTNLKALHMSNNRIIKIERQTFTHNKFPVLHTLDLSRNSLREVTFLFSDVLQLKHLDLSFNSIRSVPSLQYLPNLQHLNLSHNKLANLLENEWNQVPLNLRFLDLTSNGLRCDCSSKWVNSTFHISTNIFGTCIEPQEVASMKIRRASRLLNERCDDTGNIHPTKLTRRTSTAASGK